MTGQAGAQVQRWLTTSRPSPGSNFEESSWRVGPRSWSREMRIVSAQRCSRKAMAAGVVEGGDLGGGEEVGQDGAHGGDAGGVVFEEEDVHGEGSYRRTRTGW